MFVAFRLKRSDVVIRRLWFLHFDVDLETSEKNSAPATSQSQGTLRHCSRMRK